jgi:hypothetical protein
MVITPTHNREPYDTLLYGYHPGTPIGDTVTYAYGGERMKKTDKEQAQTLTGGRYGTFFFLAK